MLSIEYPNVHSAPPTANRAMMKLSMTALPDPHASASGMNTTATTPSGNNQQSQYSSPPGRERLDFHSLLRFEDHGPTTQAAHEHPAQSTQDRRPPPRDVRDRSLGLYPYSYDTVAAGYVGRVGTWPPLSLVLSGLRVTHTPSDKLNRKAHAGAIRRRQRASG